MSGGKLVMSGSKQSQLSQLLGTVLFLVPRALQHIPVAVSYSASRGGEAAG